VLSTLHMAVGSQKILENYLTPVRIPNQIKPAASTETVTEAGPSALTKAGLGPEISAETRPDTGVEAGPDTGLEAGPEAEIKTATEIKTETNTEIKTEIFVTEIKIEHLKLHAVGYPNSLTKFFCTHFVCLFVTMRPAGTRCICELYWHIFTSFNK
jgi:hypothetical protein